MDEGTHTRRVRRAAIFLITFWAVFLHAEEKPYYFYHGFRHGSESLMNPLFVILSGGYDIMQAENRTNNPFRIDYKTGFQNVMSNLAAPGASIRKYGWKDFLFTEIFPRSLNKTQAQYWPNYSAHLIGSGMSYRMMMEWYHFHHYPYPKTLSVATMAVMHFLNEIVENSDFRGSNVDPIADLYIFDPLGIMLFNFDSVCRFFSNTLSMNDWSNQFSYDPWNRTIQNNGQNFIMKYRFPKTAHWSVFCYYGNHGQAGVSYKRENGASISVGAGVISKKLASVVRKDTTQVRQLTTVLAYTIGLFYDRDNSLMTSLIYSDRKDNMLQLNVFPGLIEFADYSPGMFVLVDRSKHVTVGIHVRKFPIGLARKL